MTNLTRSQWFNSISRCSKRILTWKLYSCTLINRILVSLSCIPWFLRYTWRFVYLQKGTQPLKTRVHMTDLTRSNLSIGLHRWADVFVLEFTLICIWKNIYFWFISSRNSEDCLNQYWNSTYIPSIKVYLTVMYALNKWNRMYIQNFLLFHFLPYKTFWVTLYRVFTFTILSQ